MAGQSWHTCWVLEDFSSQPVGNGILVEFKDPGIPIRKVLCELLQHLEACIASDGVIDISDVGIAVFLDLGYFEVVVSQEIGVHLYPAVPVHLSDPHRDEVWSVSERPVCQRFSGVEVELFGW